MSGENKLPDKKERMYKSETNDVAARVQFSAKTEREEEILLCNSQ